MEDVGKEMYVCAITIPLINKFLNKTFTFKQLLPTPKKLLITIGLFLVFQAIQIFIHGNNLGIGFPLSYLHSKSSLFILIPDFEFSLFNFTIDILWFYGMSVLADKHCPRFGASKVTLFHNKVFLI